jgi:hypothetical protein
MKCLSRIEIQEYLDKELEPSLMAEISDHLGKCEVCSKIYNQAVIDKALIVKLMGQRNSPDEIVHVPEFKPPEEKSSKKIYLRVIELLAAASVIGLIIMIRPAGTPVFNTIPEAEMMEYEFYDGKDLNKLWHDKTQILIIQDEKGHVIQSIITN